MALEPHQQQTSGVNYPPPSEELAAEEVDSISSAPMHFGVTAEVGGTPVEMVGAMSVCGSGCRRQLLPMLKEEDRQEEEVVIVRFAKFGTSELPGGETMTWLVVMEDGDTLSGPLTLSSQPLEGEPRGFPGELKLGGRMVITVQIGDQEPIRLRSREEPILSGLVAGWPPYGMQLELENGPIEYFVEEALEDKSAEPLVKVVGNRVLLGTEPHPILSRAPEITAAERGQDGVSLTWTDTAAERPTTPPITAYHVYRNREPGEINSWELAARVPATETSWKDDTLAPDQKAEYLLVHAARCPFDYDLEGLLGTPVSV